VIRAFVALALPEAVRFDLMIVQQGLPVPRTVAPESLHLTLLFLGEVPEPVLADADAAFGAIRAPRFPVALAGLGMFGGAKPRAVFCGAAESAALRHLQAKVATAARAAGLEPEARRFVPHVTLARIKAPSGLDRPRLERFVAARATYAAQPFEAEDFRLFRSRLSASGAAYEELARYPLEGPAHR
jgi:RNA 2',3'-cyclic 3'-phosphodiesterase